MFLQIHYGFMHHFYAIFKVNRGPDIFVTLGFRHEWVNDN